MKDATIFIIDDDSEVCRALEWLVQSIHLPVKTFVDALTFLEQYDPLWHGCILLDVRMPNLSGMELLDRLQQRQNTLPVIIITGHGDIAMAVRAMKSGAIDFICKPFHEQTLLEKIQKALHQQRKPLNITELEKAAKCYATLTPRERQIMALVTEGLLNKQIAAQLGIATSTVELHRSKIMRKMGVRNLAYLIKIALLFPQ